MERNSAATFPALAVAVLNLHDPVREVTLVHIEVKAVHSDQLRKCYVVSLFIRVRQIISEHKTSFFTCMGMEVYKHQQVFSLLNYRLFCCPDSRVVLLARVEIKPIQVIGHGVQSIVPA